MNSSVMKIILRDKDIDIDQIKEILNLNDEEVMDYLINSLEDELKLLYKIKELNNKYFYYVLLKVENLQNKLLKQNRSTIVNSEKIKIIKYKLYELVNERDSLHNDEIFKIDSCKLNKESKYDKNFEGLFSELVGRYLTTKDEKYKVIIDSMLKINETDAKRLSQIEKIIIKELEYVDVDDKKQKRIYSHYSDEKKYIFSIDPENIKIREDAISITKKDNETIITVYITDPTNYYLNNTEIENEIFRNWFIENKCVTIDKDFAKDNFSLNENQKRHVIAYELTFDKNNDIKDINIYEDVIVVDKNYTYEEFNKLKKSDDMVTLLDITTKLKEENKYKTEYHLLKEIDNKVKKLKKTKTKQSGNTIVEELKILINKMLSEIFNEYDLPCIYRNNKFYVNVEDEVIELKKCEKYDRNTIKNLKNRKIELVSYYSNVCEGHFGLNLDSYMHATTPLRNYFALINILILKELIIKGKLEDKQKYEYLVDNLINVQNKHINNKDKNYKKTLVKTGK